LAEKTGGEREGGRAEYGMCARARAYPRGRKTHLLQSRKA